MNYNKMLDGQVAIVTGTSSGIGRATAQLFARHGAKVVGADVNEPAGNQTVESIRTESGDSIFVRTDVGRFDDIRALVDASVAKYGRIDIVVSNAASYKVGTATDLSEEDWDRTLAVCLKATWALAHCAMPHMLKQPKGSFIITGSVHSIRGYAKHAAYQASKGGLLALTRSLAADYAPTIRVNTILPGAVITGLAAGLSKERLDEIAKGCVLRRNAPPEDIANVALFLASDMSSYMTATSLVVDGGLASVIQPY